MLLVSPNGEKALCPCCPQTSEVFWGALLVLVSKTALTHIINHFLLYGGMMGGVWVGHILEDLRATKGSSGEAMKVTASVVQCPHSTFPPSGRRGRVSDICNTLWCWEHPGKCKISHADSKLQSIKCI